MNVLLAMDQFDLRLALEIALREEPGVSVVGAVGEANSLLALIGTAEPDVVICDWALPGLSPRTLVARIAAREQRPRLLLIVETDETIPAATEGGADCVVVKGDPPGHFLRALRLLRAPRSP